MAIIQGLVIFLVETNSHIKGVLPIFSISYILDDFIEQYKEELKTLTKRDYDEISKIRKNPYLITESYLFSRIEPFLLPFYQKRNSTDF